MTRGHSVHPAVALLIGVSVFSVQDPIIKALSGAYPVTETIAFRGIAALPIFTFLVWRAGGLPLLWTKRPRALAGRGVLLMASYTCYYLSLPELPLATTAALWFTGPLFMVALSRLITGEHQGWRRWAAVSVGLAGVLVIAHPSNAESWAIALPVASAVFYATGQLTARRIGQGIPAPVISWHQNTVYVVASLGVALLLAPFVQGFQAEGSVGFLLRPWAMPTGSDALLLALCGPVAGIGSTLLVYAYRSAPPGGIAVIEYVAMLWAVLWGFVVFGDVPDVATLAGAALIIASGVYAITRPPMEPHPRR